MALAHIKRILLSGISATLLTWPTAASASTISYTPESPISDYWNLDNGQGEQVEPKLASNGNGQLVAIWTLQHYGNIQAATSTDNGVTWSPPTTIYTGKVKPLSVHHTGSGWVAQWARETEDQQSLEHLISKSSDGVSWSAPVIRPTELSNTSGSFPFHGDAESNGAETLLTSFGANIARSTDGGNTWSIITLPDADSYDSVSEAQIAYAGSNKWYLVIHGTYYVTTPDSFSGGIRTNFYSSLDNGATWSAPIGEISSFNQFQDMAALGDTIVVANYPSFSVTTNGGGSWTSGMPSELQDPAPQDITVDENGNWTVAVQVWGENLNPYLKASTIQLLKSTDPANGWAAPINIAADAEHRYTNPALIHNGNGGFAVAYQSYDLQTVRPGPDSDIAVQTSNNTGGTWSVPAMANTDHANDFSYIDDKAVQLVRGDDGVVIAAWAANTDQVRDSGKHVMYARSENYGATWSNTAPITPSYNVAFSLNDWVYGKPGFYLIYAGQGRWVLIFGYGTFDEKVNYYSISDDNGFSWSAAAELNAGLIGGNGNGTVIKYMKQGTDGIHAISRLPRNSTTWEEPVMLPGDESPGFLVNTSGHNWFASASNTSGSGGTATGVVYISTDDGRTWTQNTGINLPNFASRFDVDEAGNVVVLYFRHLPSPPVAVEIFVTRSTDNGVTWTSPEPMGTGVYSMTTPVSDFKFGDIAHIGNNTWIILWQNSQYSISTDGGATWSSRIDLPFEAFGPLSLPSITGADGRFTMAWQQNQTFTRLLDGIEDDIYYSYGTYGVNLAAQDWQLFE